MPGCRSRTPAWRSPPLPRTFASTTSPPRSSGARRTCWSTGSAPRLPAPRRQPVRTIVDFARATGPADGLSEVLIARGRSSPMMAALANGASSHFAEQDDVHNGSVFHPATVVFPAALATAQAVGASGREMLAAAVAGYEVGIRVGEFLGRSHYKVFHTTGTAGTVAAAAAAARVLRLSPGSHAACHRFGGHAGGGPVGVPARRGGFQAAARRRRGRHGADGCLARPRRTHGRAPCPRGTARHGGRHVERRRSEPAGRRLRLALGHGRDVVQVARVVPAHPPGRGRLARRRQFWAQRAMRRAAFRRCRSSREAICN